MKYSFFLLAMSFLISCGNDLKREVKKEVCKTKSVEKSFDYDNTLIPEDSNIVIFKSSSDFIAPIQEPIKFKSSTVVKDSLPDIYIKSWRYSFNARGIISFDNFLNSKNTAIVVMHPINVDNEGGMQTPSPNGTILYCTPEKNGYYNKHLKEVLVPFLEKWSGKVNSIIYNLPHSADSIRKNIYPSIYSTPNNESSIKNKKLLDSIILSQNYIGDSLPKRLKLSKRTTGEYFKKFRGLFLNKYNGKGFEKLPKPLHSSLKLYENSYVVFDKDNYDDIRDKLKEDGVSNILLIGYAADFCLKVGVLGYQNIREDFNLYIVGDLTLATFPAMSKPNYATTVQLSRISTYQMITEMDWIKPL